MAKLVSKTYGEALFELAVKENMTDALMEEVIAVQEILKENPDFALLMKHPKISKEESIEIMRNVFEHKVSEELVGFMVLVLSKGRYGDIDAIFNYFIARVKEANGIGTVYVTTAISLSKEKQTEIEKKLLETTDYCKLEINYLVDKSLIGGMRIRIKDRVVDSSIKTKLEGMERTLQKIQLTQ